MDASALKSAEMQQFLNSQRYEGVFCDKIDSMEEKQRAMVNELVGKITSSCWDKCITSTPGSKFSSSETNCLTNCAQRYMDMSVLIIKRFQSIN